MDLKTVASTRVLHSGKPVGPKSYVKVLFTALFLCLFTIVNCSTIAYGEQRNPYLFIDPTIYVAKEYGELFDVAIKICNVENLRSFELTITYNKSLLNVEQVTQGTFFPSPPESSFAYANNESFGSICIEATLAGSETPRSGNGTLVNIRFKVIHTFLPCGGNPIELSQTVLNDGSSELINHDSVSAVYFWRSIQPDPPVGDRLLDLYTQNGGEGLDVPDGEFVLGEVVYLRSNVTYNGSPLSNKPVAFEVQNPLGEVTITRTTFTNQDGIAEISFRIPSMPSSIGVWNAISVVDIAEETTWDTVTFRVTSSQPPTIPVGGYSLALDEHTSRNVLGYYLPLAAFLMVGFAAIRRRSTKRKR